MSLVAPTASTTGQEFNLLVQATSNSEVKSLSFDLVYDPQLVDVVRVNQGAFLNQGDAQTKFQTDQVEGRISISIDRKAGAVRGSGAVAVVVLRGKGDDPSPAQFSIENAKVQDASGAPLSAGIPSPVTVGLTP